MKILIILLILLIIIGSINFIMYITANSMCKKECLLKGTIFYDKIHSGNWRIDDMCVCYLYNGEIETMRLGK